MHSGECLHERYRIGERLGQGTMALTCAGQDLQTGREVVIKELRLSGLDHWKRLELFEREARVLQQLQHPRIPALVEFFQVQSEQDQLFYLVSERVPGASLEQKLHQHWRLSESEALSLAAQMLEILVYLHGLHPPVIHRDLKPANLILSPEQALWLVDFGGVQTQLNPQGGGTVVGTFGYMAPEQFAGKAIPASDLYSLGATLIHLLTGTSPAEMSREDLRLDFRPWWQGSAALAQFLQKLTEPSVERRFSSAQAALEALEALRAGRGAADLQASDWPLPHLSPGPAGTRISVVHNSQRLLIELPASPNDNLTALNLLGMSFLAWLPFLISLDYLSHWLAFFVFSLPLLLLALSFSAWFLSYLVLQQHLALTPQSLKLETHLSMLWDWSHKFQLQDLESLTLEKGRFPVQYTRALVLRTRSGATYALGHLLTLAEKEWLRQEIFKYLESCLSPAEFERLQGHSTETQAL